MARYPEFEPLYEAFQTFVDRCIINDTSIIWPDRHVWSQENLQEIKRRFVDSPELDKKVSFEEKLEKQLEGGKPELWMLVADIYYVYFLPSSYITLKKRQDDIQWAAHQAGATLPTKDLEIWKPHKEGFTRTSQKYHFKFAQFQLLILFALRLKENENRKTILENSDAFQNLLDEILYSIPDKIYRAYDFRHALLYLAFPDRYERIISTSHKEEIVKTYKDLIDGPLPEDLDKAIFKIRSKLSVEHKPDGRPFDFYRDVQEEWRSDYKPPKPPSRRPGRQIADSPEGDERRKEVVDPDLKRVLDALNHTKNVVLFGPPGTGKTYLGKQAAEFLIREQLSKAPSEKTVVQRAIDDLPFYDILALSMFQAGAGSKYKVPEIETLTPVQTRYQVSPVKHPKNHIWGYLQSHTDLESETVKYTNRAAPYLFDKTESSQWFLTEVGKEYVQENLSDQLELLRAPYSTSTKVEDYVRSTTFHQSYSYEDFVEGLRPVSSEGESGSVSYEIVPGVFRKLCALAEADPESIYVLIVDEINRGNIAKILGELITLLEDDKRSGAENAMPIELTYSQQEFLVPDNLYFIGTMNTADRSIALVDVALRRRFAFVEVMPRPDLLKDTVVASKEADISLQALLEVLNREITRLLDRNHQIGHSYFLKVKDATEHERPEVLEFVWNNQIFPLLEEYFFNQRDTLAEILEPFQIEKDETETGYFGTSSLEIARLQGEDLLSALAVLVV